MYIEEALIKVSQAPEGSVLVAKPPFSWGSEAMFVQLDDDYEIPDSILKLGYECLLDLDDIEGLLLDIKGKKISSRAIAEYVIHYAAMDCAPEWLNDIPDH